MCNERNFGMSGGCVGEMPKGPLVKVIDADEQYIASIKRENQQLKARELECKTEIKRLKSELTELRCLRTSLEGKLENSEHRYNVDTKGLQDVIDNLMGQLEDSKHLHKKDVVERNGIINHLENIIKSSKFCSCSEETVASLEKEQYLELERVLRLAYEQAAYGKGRDRHANNKAFVDQPILSITRMVGDGYPLGQAMKKAQEAHGLPSIDAKKAELLGAINYLAACVIYYEEQQVI